VISSDYGERGVIYENTDSFHYGIDLVGDKKIKAIADGKVVACGKDEYGANAIFVAIQHADGYVSIYYHLESYSVKTGDTVKQGAQIGIMGSTGLSTGPHLHLEIRDCWRGSLYPGKAGSWKDDTVNPKDYIIDLNSCKYLS